MAKCRQLTWSFVDRPHCRRAPTHGRGAGCVRLRPYEISNTQMSTDMTPDNGDDMLRQVGIKIWVDGSPYLDTDATRIIGVPPGSCGQANYTREQLAEIVGAHFPRGWPMACHVQGDAGVDTILDVYEEALRRWPRDNHRLRLEHGSRRTGDVSGGSTGLRLRYLKSQRPHRAPSATAGPDT